MFKAIKSKWAKRVMRKDLADPSYSREILRHRIAACIYDNRRKDGRLNRLNCQALAEKLIKLIFG